VWANAYLLALGLLNTLKVTGAALAFGVPLGLVLALMRLSPRRLLAWPAGAVIEVFRTTPPLVQLFWFFFALPILIKVEMTPYVAAVLTFSFQSNEVAQKTFRPLEVFTVTALIYFAVIFAASQLVHGLERRLAASGEGMAR